MDIPEYWFFQNLHTAKHFFDSGYLKKFLQTCGDYCLDDECDYELAWDGIACIFPNLCSYYNDEIELETIVLFDPLIDEFFRLCSLYEKQEGLPHGSSDLRISTEREIYCNFDLYGYHYDYDFRICHDDHGRGRMVILMGCEFCGFDQLPVVLADVRNELERQVKKLQKELNTKATQRKKQKIKILKEAA